VVLKNTGSVTSADRLGADPEFCESRDNAAVTLNLNRNPNFSLWSANNRHDSYAKDQID
jgi:hypothetical protein